MAYELSPRPIVLIGEEGVDRTGLLYQEDLLRRDEPYVWMELADALRQIEGSDGLTLLDHAKRSPLLFDRKPEDFWVAPSSPLDQARAVVILDMEYAAYLPAMTRIFERAQIPQSNSARSVDLASDKWLTQELVEAAGIATPRSLLVNSLAETNDAVEELGLPLVIKDLLGTKGDSVRLARTETDVQAIVTELRLDLQPLIFQHYVECGARDKRVVAVDGIVLDTYERCAQDPNEFRSNTALGGSLVPAPLEEDEREMTLAACKQLGLELAGMDIARVSEVLPGREYLSLGQAFFIEANPFPAFRVGDVAPPYAVDLLLKRAAELGR